MMFRETTDRYDELRREWIAEHSGIFTMQMRRAEVLNRRIRRRNRDRAGARPDPYDDNAAHPLLTRPPNTVEARLELILVAVVAVAAPLGWPLGRWLYARIEALIPQRLRSYPIVALLWAGIVLGILTTLFYSFRDSSSLSSAALAPWIMAQLPATFLAAGIYGILNGWLAIDGSLDWWPLAPPPATIDMNVPLAADDLTGPSVFVTAEAPLSSHDLTPITRARGGSPALVVTALLVSAIGTVWTLGAVAVGIKGVVSHYLSTPTPSRLVSDF
jgi:hypothetical protein